MELLELMHTRRSIRSFKPDPVPDEIFPLLIEAASYAPSGSNIQAWRFGIITDSGLVHKINLFSPGMSGNPPALIIACSDRKYALKHGGTLAADCMAALDCALASQNIMLAAHSFGLGTCPIKSYNDSAVRTLLQLPEYITIELILSIGYPELPLPSMPVRKSYSDITFQNTFKEDNLG